MPLSISPSVADTLTSPVKQALGKMPEESQSTFEAEFTRKSRNPFLLFIFTIIGIHYFVLGEIGKGLFFWLTMGGLGVWWLIDLATSFKKTKAFNEDLAVTILRDMKVMGS